MELWRDVVGYEKKYIVSNVGNVKSLNFGRTGKERELKKIKEHTGYYSVSLCSNGKKKIELIHRLVANAFLQNKDNKREINHIDGNKENNCVENLEWVSSSENHIHAFENGLMPQLYQKGHKYRRWN